MNSVYEEVIATFDEEAAWSIGTPFEEVLGSGACALYQYQSNRTSDSPMPSYMDLALVEFVFNIIVIAVFGEVDAILREPKNNFYHVFMDAESEAHDAFVSVVTPSMVLS